MALLTNAKLISPAILHIWVSGMFLVIDVWMISVNLALTCCKSVESLARFISFIKTPGLLAWATIRSCSEITPLISDFSEEIDQSIL